MRAIRGSSHELRDRGGVGQNAGKRFFSKCLAQGQGRTPAEYRNWRLSIYDVIRSRAPEQGTLGVERMCHLAVVSRASYYRHWEEVAPDEAEMAARVSIQEVVLRHRRRYGYRRVTEDLHRQGMVINHKRVARIMREDNLLAIRYRKYILTTNSQHDCQVYESGGTHDGDRYQPALGGGYHLYRSEEHTSELQSLRHLVC